MQSPKLSTWTLFAFMLLTLVAVACAPAPAPAVPATSAPTAPTQPASAPTVAAPAPKVTIEMWTPRQPEEDALEQAAAKRFMATHPNIEVKISAIPGGQNALNQKLQLALAGGTPPDLVDLSWVRTQEWAAKDALMPLDAYLAKDMSVIQPDDFVQSIWQVCAYDGHVYGMPYTTDARALFYNKQLFREAGLDPEKPPKDWTELADYAKKLTKKDPSGRLTQVGLLPTYDQGSFLQWLYLNAGDAMSKDMKTATFNNKEGLEAIQFIDQVAQDTGVQSLQTFQQGIGQAEANPFFSKRLAMWFTGPWVFGDLKKYAPDLLSKDLGVAPLPPAPGKTSVSLAGGFAVMIPKGAKNPDAAWEFIKFYTSKAEITEIMKAQLWLPVRQSVMADKSWQTGNDYLAPILEAVKTSRPFIYGPVVSPFYPALSTAVDEVTLKKKTPQQALDDAAAAVQKELDTFYKH